MSKQHVEQWGTRIGVILAVAGSAVGLGNFLRFPGQAAENGGGAFMIPYFCALLFLGIPIGWAEWTMGRYGGRKGFHSAPGILGVVGKGRGARYFGVIGVLIPLAVFFYYTLIEAWCLGYCFEYLTTGLGIERGAPVAEQVAAANQHFEKFTGVADDGAVFELGLFETMLGFWIVTFVVNAFFLYRGLSKGIEKFCMYAMPLMGLIGIIVLIRVLTLGTPDPSQPERNVLNGLGYMWNPDLKELLDADTWLAAAGQIFFSLSVGFGVIINYASYMRKKDDVVLSGLTATSTNEFFEVCLGGMITLPAAFIFLGVLDPSVIQSSFSVGFKTLPVVFEYMPLGNLFGAAFFFMLFLAAITSSLSMLQPTLAFFQEALGLKRGVGVTVVLGVSLIGNLLVIQHSKDLTALDTIDFWVGTFLIFVLAMVQIICFSWVFGVDRGLAEAHDGAQMRIPTIYRFIMKYVTPVYLLVIFGVWCYQSLGDRVEAAKDSGAVQWALALIACTTLMLLVMTWVGERRWRALGLDVDGKHPPAD
jgi:NSS family neurotransmitter:Na+ symporter